MTRAAASARSTPRPGAKPRAAAKRSAASAATAGRRNAGVTPETGRRNAGGTPETGRRNAGGATETGRRSGAAVETGRRSASATEGGKRSAASSTSSRRAGTASATAKRSGSNSAPGKRPGMAAAPKRAAANQATHVPSGRGSARKRADGAAKAAQRDRPEGGRRKRPSKSDDFVPEKIHKVLAQAGLGSRREMEELIRAGRVRINGDVAQVGMRVNAGDLIKVGRRQVTVRAAGSLPRVILYHKPEGEIVSRDDPQGRPSVFEKLPALRRGKWLAIGRLDYNTCGLLIFTTSGELANRLMHPRYEVEREYAVRILGELSPQQQRVLTKGVRLEDGEAHFDSIAEQGGKGANKWYRVILREGRNRVVRRMFEALGLTVSRLMRVRFGEVILPPRLKRGAHFEMDDEQTTQMLEWAGTLQPITRTE